MKRLYCKLEKVGEVAVGAVLLLIAILFCIFGFVTLAPVVGLFLAVPVIAFSVYLFGTPQSKTCSL
jgi:Sec-independent protein secretion pathway component TatC